MESNSQIVLQYHDAPRNEKEEQALTSLKNELLLVSNPEDKKFINEELLEDVDLLLSHLRLQKLNTKKAIERILNVLKWKVQVKAEEIYLNYKLPNIQSLYNEFPNKFHKTTKQGLPIYISLVGRANINNFFALTTQNDLINFNIQSMEYLQRVISRVCSNQAQKYIPGVFDIMDFHGLGRQIMDKRLFSYYKEYTRIRQEYYPDSSTACYILNAGLIFRGLFSVIKVFLDAKTKESIKILGSNYQKELLEVVDKENLPTFYGGECCCEGGCMFSGAGPWNEGREIIELSDQERQKRKEINASLILKKDKVTQKEIEDLEIQGKKL